MRSYWLFKSDPDAYSFSDLIHEPNQTAEWDGVRNYQARNYLRDQVQVGDGILFYHSNTSDPGVVGTAEVVRGGYPDHTAMDKNSDHPDAKSTPERPIWFMVDIKALHEFKEPLSLQMLKTTPGLEGMVLLQKGTRLSIQPVAEREQEIVLSLSGCPSPNI
jgi:predicted RNA-binding protein with PUA-like domain